MVEKDAVQMASEGVNRAMGVTVPYRYGGPTTTASTPGSSSKPVGWLLGTVVVACGVLIVIFLVAIQSGSSGGGGGSGGGGSNNAAESDPKVQQAVAFDTCKEFVKRRLKAPSTAKFRNFWQDDGEVVVDGTGPQYKVISTVDSENGFGAMLRSNFVCTVTDTGDTWRLDDIAIV